MRDRKPHHRARFEVVAILLSLFFLLPIYWLAQSTTKDNGELLQGTFVPAVPGHFISNLAGVFTYDNGVFLHWLKGPSSSQDAYIQDSIQEAH